jgi:DNA-binding GntR family transcriptional regulator
MTLLGTFKFDTAKKASAPELIAQTLRRAILDGTITGGTQLKQNDVAAQFGVSIVPVREALQRLIADGLAVLHPNRGVTVTDISENDFLDIAELRALLEPQALRRSAPRLTAADFIQAEKILHRAEETSDPLDRADLHWEFHKSLYQQALRPRLLAQIAGLYRSINRYLLPMWASCGLSPGWVESHLIIVAALRDNKIDEACHLIVAQTLESSERVIDQLRQEQKNTGKQTR